MSVKAFRNDGDKELNVPGIGVIEPGQQVGVSGEYLPPIILSNFPGLVDVTEEETSNQQPVKPKQETPDEQSV